MPHDLTFKRSADDPPALRMRRERLERRVRHEDAEVWLEVPLGDGWVAAYRLVGQQGSPVVAELRVFPGHRSPEPGREVARWSGRAQDVPEGGLSARDVRRVKVGEHRAFVPLLTGELADTLGVEVFEPSGLLGAAGLTQERPEVFLAQVAAAYVQSVAETPRRPNVTVAERLHLSPSYVAELVMRARRQGLLTAATNGRAGGQLTARARELLQDVDHKKAPARRRSTRKGR